MQSSLFQTLLTNVAQIQLLIEPTTVKSSTGSADVWENADSKRIVAPNAIVKNVNCTFQLNVTDTAPAEYGYLEYAFVVFEERQALPTVDALIQSGLPTQTLMDLTRNLYGGKCLFTGVVPVGNTTPTVLQFPLKLPDKHIKYVRGKYLTLICNFRSRDSTDTTSVLKRLVTVLYKVYV